MGGEGGRIWEELREGNLGSEGTGEKFMFKTFFFNSCSIRHSNDLTCLDNISFF